MHRLPSFLGFCLAVTTLALLASACSVEVEAPVRDLGSSRAPAALAPPEPAAPTEAPAPPTDAPLSDSAATFAPTLEFLVEARAKTNAASSFRFEGYFESLPFGLAFGSRTQPMILGEVSGDRSKSAADRTNFVSENMRSLTSADQDLITTIVTEGQTAYVTTPFFQVLIGGAGGGGPSWADDVATGWGRVDLNSLSHSEIIGSIAIGTGPSGTELLGLIDSAEDVRDGGTGDVRGVPTQVVNFDVTLLAIVELDGEDFNNTNLTDGQIDLLANFRSTVELHVDAEGYVRRFEYSSGFNRLAEDDLGQTLTDWRRVDYFDFDTDIGIEIPPDWVDVTEGLKDFAGN